MVILSIDVGTTLSGYCFVDRETYKPIEFGKIDNNVLIKLAKEKEYGELVYEAFACYGMPIGASTIDAIQWNGRFIQIAMDRGIETYPIFRKEEKINLCGNMKAKDSNIKQALVDRFAKFDLKTGKGTKKKPDWFYGFSADAWSAYAIAVTHIDKRRGLT